MAAFAEMLRIQKKLESLGLSAVTPDPNDDVWSDLSPKQATSLKRMASMRHMRRIRHADTAAILVVNLDRYGTPDYIGPNTFAEIGLAFAHGREIFLLQDMPAQYAEELAAWGAVCLKGSLRNLVRATEQLQVPADRPQLVLFR